MPALKEYDQPRARRLGDRSFRRAADDVEERNAALFGDGLADAFLLVEGARKAA